MVLVYDSHADELVFNSPVTLEPSLSILIVNEDPVSRFILQSYLLHDKPHLHIDVALSKDAALQLFRSRLHHLIFLDLYSPKSHRLNWLAKLREVAGIAPLTVIGCADATDQTYHASELLHEGISAILPKPFTQDELWAVLMPVLVQTTTVPRRGYTTSNKKRGQNAPLFAG